MGPSPTLLSDVPVRYDSGKDAAVSGGHTVPCLWTKVVGAVTLGSVVVLLAAKSSAVGETQLIVSGGVAVKPSVQAGAPIQRLQVGRQAGPISRSPDFAPRRVKGEVGAQYTNAGANFVELNASTVAGLGRSPWFFIASLGCAVVAAFLSVRHKAHVLEPLKVGDGAGQNWAMAATTGDTSDYASQLTLFSDDSADLYDQMLNKPAVEEAGGLFGGGGDGGGLFGAFAKKASTPAPEAPAAPKVTDFFAAPSAPKDDGPSFAASLFAKKPAADIQAPELPKKLDQASRLGKGLKFERTEAIKEAIPQANTSTDISRPEDLFSDFLNNDSPAPEPTTGIKTFSQLKRAPKVDTEAADPFSAFKSGGEVTAPKPTPEIKAPEIKAPEIKAPEFKAPEVPEVKAPEPKFEMPKPEPPAPTPPVEVPTPAQPSNDFADFFADDNLTYPEPPKAPEGPKFELPKFEMPKPPAPKVEVEVPTKVPEVKAPEFKFEVPKPEPPAPTPPVEVPKPAGADQFADFFAADNLTPEPPKAPEGPKFELPKFELPKPPAPKVMEVPPKVVEVPTPTEKLDQASRLGKGLKFEKAQAISAAKPPAPAPEAPKLDADPFADFLNSGSTAPAETPKVVDLSNVKVPPKVESADPFADFLKSGSTAPAEAPKAVELSKVEVPKVQMPKVEVPKVEAPKLEVPKAIPKVEVPSKVVVPKASVEADPFAQFKDAPAVQAPVAPKAVPTPEVVTPKFVSTPVEPAPPSELTSTMDSIKQAIANINAEAEKTISAINAVPSSAHAKVDALLAAYHAQLKEIYDAVPLFLHPLLPENPDVLGAGAISLLLGVTVGLPIYTVWNLQYGGYSGDLTAEEVEEMLQDVNTLLVDIRDPATIEGVPDLRRSARSRAFLADAVATLDPALRKKTRNAPKVELALQALTLSGYKKIRRAKRVVVMDDSGRSSKAMARLLRERGIRRPYNLKGGYQAWADAGLATRASYNATVGEFLKQEVEALSEADDNILGRANAFVNSDEGKKYIGLGLALSAIILANLKLVLEVSAAAAAAKISIDVITDKSYARPRVGPDYVKPVEPEPEPKRNPLDKIVQDAKNFQQGVVDSWNKFNLFMLKEQWAIPGGDAAKLWEEKQQKQTVQVTKEVPVQEVVAAAPVPDAVLPEEELAQAKQEEEVSEAKQEEVFEAKQEEEGVKEGQKEEQGETAAK